MFIQKRESEYCLFWLYVGEDIYSNWLYFVLVCCMSFQINQKIDLFPYSWTYSNELSGASSNL